jgi:hypothetical protein
VVRHLQNVVLVAARRDAGFSATEPDDAHAELNRQLSATHEWFGSSCREQGGAVLDIALGADEFTEGLLGGGRVGPHAQDRLELLAAAAWS